ncbi:pyruvate dehydrogenase [Marinobacterium aestuariivivens]|uniref:Pyruvate dehydrogenase n=1 Tax=Marinobacterium aestuariivivens TaxID=1698799 RepID=A0ABW2A972_9GAMM
MSIFEDALERTDGKTLILSNGSKWAGSSPDSIQILLDVLGKEVLDPMFERYHCYRAYPFSPLLKTGRNEAMFTPWLGAKRFFGNFLTVSHVFNIISKDSEVIEALSDAIRKNMETEEYQRHAYERYAGWFYAETSEGHQLVSPKEADDIRNGNVTKSRYPRNYEALKTAVLIGPRFEETAKHMCA